VKRFVGVALGLVVFAGCVPSASPSPSVSVAPSVTCTPVGASPKPCSTEEAQRAEADAKLYADAEAVYRRFFEENVRIYRLGGTEEPTPVLKETTTGFFQRAAMSVYGDLRTEGSKGRGTARLVTVVPRVALQYEGSVAALEVCFDARGMGFWLDGREVSRGPVGRETVYLKSFDGLLKLFYVESELVKSCG
jgi:hypothetical protein